MTNETEQKLKVLGDRLQRIDESLVHRLALRHRLALQVGRLKSAEDAAIYRPIAEQDRVDASKAWAKRLKMNPEFVAGIMYSVIRESCMDQLIQRETNSNGLHAPATYEEKKANLMALTTRIAPTFDAEYVSHVATKGYLAFEDAILENLIQELGTSQRGRFLDLGCGTGNVSFRAAYLFKSVVGYELSPVMVQMATEKAAKNHPTVNATFKVADLEEGIPESDQSASFVAMTLGTAGDMRDIARVISETLRVLERGGRFLFSFYNREALLYNWDYLPWDVPLAARINLDDSCLDVEAGDDIFQVFAHPYTSTEVRSFFSEGVTSLALRTYPTIASMLPKEAFSTLKDGHIERVLSEIDRSLQFGNAGVYIIATGAKA